jgi:hypothetical protein
VRATSSIQDAHNLRCDAKYCSRDKAYVLANDGEEVPESLQSSSDGELTQNTCTMKSL